MQRGAGVLMHIASLPGPFGIGVFGEEAIDFAKQLKKQGMKYWQVLPFSYPGMGNSPYQSFSAFAGNRLFIDPRRLMRLGLLTGQEVVKAELPDKKWHIDYDFNKIENERFLRTAFYRIGDDLKAKIVDFASSHKWVDDVALYLTIKEANDNKAWWDWEDEKLKNRDEDSLAKIREKKDYQYHLFVQYIFVTQWKEIKEQINCEGIKIIGDMPIYVSGDSADVWANRDLFKMAQNNSEDIVFDKVAGVPPDYFCKDGQLWGNPIYEWSKHESSNFAWWMDRFEANFELYDLVRIDHFRSLSSYWEIDASSTTAKEGKWVEGPGMRIIDAFKERFGDTSKLIAEDLGDKTPDVDILLKESGLPNMRVMQFGFVPQDDSSNLPHNFAANCVAYTGTHDNNTLLGWLWEVSEDVRNFALRYCAFTGNTWGEGGTRSESCRAIIRTLWMSHANCVIIPIQDELGYGRDTRMNTPGTVDGNWMIRFSKEDLASIDDGWYSELNKLYKR